MMPVVDVLSRLVTQVAGQVDPNQGTAAVQKGLVNRLAEPQLYDIVFPFIAFLLVIVLPTTTAVWAIVKTLKDDRKESDET
jgi:hypothetical protein